VLRVPLGHDLRHRVDMVLKADCLAVTHPPYMRVVGLQLAAGFGLAAEGADHDEMIAGVDKGIWLSLKLIEVLGHRRENVVGDALGAAEGALRSPSTTRLVRFDLRVEGLQDRRNVSAV